ncbi:MAG TPA: CocE/NonD family hydrolase [Ideonella sp.]|uniref:CocE/NonD family hydrolase n=1 Tax=Ideonella sp. TaxID=1929293 RepID=UPI002E2F3A40|nr:CocE/NonD family hydrolase [Ideonella sp.]HEX5685442.1 CocE/NonD family hydrolase [Ideonella sp.]
MTEAVKEVVNVETGFDRDRDGKTDTIKVEITRPNAAEGARVPMIIHASPYFFQGSRAAWETDFFVPRGYAVATVALPGTDFSTGCADVGGNREVLGTKAVIDWANGRANGFHPDGSKADATLWTDGKTGMIGVSWDGTIANAVASTGVEGLKTIVPVAAISSWYDYTRGNGIPFYEEYVKFLNDYVSHYNSQVCEDMTPTLQAKSDDPTGSYNKWWSVRDYHIDASKLKASVFLVHGLTDENVKTRHFGEWWDDLVKNGVERRLFLHQDQHVEPYYEFGSTYSTPLLQWFDYYLQGLDNGLPNEPQAIIQRENKSWSTDTVWPPVGTQDQKLQLTSPLGRPAGALTTQPANVRGDRYLTFKQSSDYSSDSIVSSPTSPRGDRLVFMTDALAEQVRQSGTASVTLRVKVDRKAAGLQARVVDYTNGAAYIVSRTIADLGHHKSWKVKEDLVPGTWYEITWEINADDRIFAAGHNLGLVITAEKPNPLIAYEPVTATVDTRNSFLTIPLSGSLKSMASLASARELAPMVAPLVGPAGPSRDVNEFIREFFHGSKQ